MTRFALSTRNTTYAFAVDPAGLLRPLHWGGLIPTADDLDAPAKWDLSTNDMLVDVTAEEYPMHGSFRYKEQCLAVTFADGTRDIRPEFREATEADDGHLIVTLADDHQGLAVDLHYRTFDDLDLIERWAEIRNESAAAMTVTRAFSAAFTVPFDDLVFRNVHGMWAAEEQPFAQQVGFAKLIVESRKGVSNHHHNPSFVLDRGATETTGEVWFGALRWSGTFAARIEQSQFGGTTACIGINDYDFAYDLGPGQGLSTPPVVAGYTDGGLGSMSHALHEFGRRLMTPDIRPVLYNSWEATAFDVTADNQIALAQKAAQVGAELFVVDDGWFGRRGEPADGLGDWQLNAEKFPDGLDPLIDEVHRLGMSFGIWVEPEMVSPNSDLMRAHPDWIHRDPDREPDTARDQHVLDLSRQDVRDFIVETLDALLSTYDISYVKWDANRPMAQVGARQDVWLTQTLGLYEVVERIKNAHPDVHIEACASGGGRIDFGALTVFDDFWTSDNTDALDRLTIQRGYSMLYPAKAMRAWVTDSPNFLTQRAIPLTFRFRSAMCGTLGIGADLSTFSEDDLALAARHVAEYVTIRDTVQNGRSDRLDNPSPNDYRIVQYTRPEQAVVFVFLPSSRIGRRGTRVRLRGLDPAARYRFRANWIDQEKSGDYLMHHGIDVWLQGDYASELIILDRV
ncbi:MAG: alpha-galactosidase [Candidatus Nanopelagicales bacterium]